MAYLFVNFLEIQSSLIHNINLSNLLVQDCVSLLQSDWWYNESERKARIEKLTRLTEDTHSARTHKHTQMYQLTKQNEMRR